MAIVKNNFRVSRLDTDFSPGSRDSILNDDNELHARSSMSESDESEDDEVDSGAGSDDCDLAELGETGEEFCQLRNQSCSIPYELYDLPDLSEILSLDTWNECLTEDERFGLAEYLPDMDQEMFMRTLKELFSGSNFHFGSPLAELFNRLKGGLCEPRVALYRQGLNFFQRRKHYNLLRKYQNSIVGSLIQIRDAWANCAGYSIEERLRLLNIVRSQRSLMNEKDEGLGFETDSSGKEESSDDCWTKRLKHSGLGSKMSSQAAYAERLTLDVSSPRGARVLEQTKYGKQNPKGILKIAAPKAASKKGCSEALGLFPSASYCLDAKSRSSASTLALPRQDRILGYDSGPSCRRTQMIDDDVRGEDDNEDDSNDYDDDEMSKRNSRDAIKGSSVTGVRFFKPGKKKEFLKKHGIDARIGLDEEDTNSYLGLPFSIKTDNLYSHGRNSNTKNLDVLTGKPHNNIYAYHSQTAGKKAKYAEKFQQARFDDWVNTAKERAQGLLPKGSPADWSGEIRLSKTQEEAQSRDHSVNFDEWNPRSKKMRKWEEFQTSKSSLGLDSKAKSRRTFPAEMNDSYFQSDGRAKASQGKIKRKFAQNGGISMYAHSEETESDSLDQADEDGDTTAMRKLAYPGSMIEGLHSASGKSVNNPKKVRKVRRSDKREYGQVLDGLEYFPAKADLGERQHMPEIEIYSSKGKQRGKINESSYLHEYGTEQLKEKNFSASAGLGDGYRQKYKSVKSGQVRGDPSGRLSLPFLKAYSTEKKRKGKGDADYSVLQPNYMHGYGSMEDDDFVTNNFNDDQSRTCKTGKRVAETHPSGVDNHGRLNMPLLGSNSIAQKRKGKVDEEYMDRPEESNYLQSGFNDNNFMKKRGKKKVDGEASSTAMVASDVVISERGTADAEQEMKPLKKPFTLITPSVHTGFSFSIIHLLSAVRVAMMTSHSEDLPEIGNHLDRNGGRVEFMKEEHSKKPEEANGIVSSHEHLDVNSSEHAGQKKFPSLTVQEIVNCVRSNPGDPCILETQEPLQDLIRGVLKIFSSKTAPLGAKGWKALVFYEKSTKSWSWVGPVPSDHDMVEEETSSAAWGVSHKMLVKLVDAFANWLKSGQETLQQIGSLPAPPVMLMSPNMDEKERFRDLRAQKSLTTISPSSDEVRAYFHKEEVLRYLVPDRAFSYTAADGKKSIVAPLRRGGGKPTSKARDHFMLKPDRPPHVTILCLVRDAAARLPGSIGTRADVCTLIRDSQYIVEDVSDAQVNQVVSGALDRLHYERDPCVQFDGDRKLWVYLHRDREEEDFEDDGTSSTKKWKRQRKDATEQSDLGNTDQAAASGSAAGYDFGSDFNAGSSSALAGEKTELVYNDLRPNMKENVEPFVGSGQGSMRQGHVLGWEVLELNAQEKKMVCQENSTNEDFDEETFSRERSVGLLSASLI